MSRDPLNEIIAQILDRAGSIVIKQVKRRPRDVPELRWKIGAGRRRLNLTIDLALVRYQGDIVSYHLDQALRMLHDKVVG